MSASGPPPLPPLSLADPHDTIAAIATPGGAGGVGILRVSGPGAWALAQAIFRPTRSGQPIPVPGQPLPPPSHLPARRLVLGWVLDPASGQVLDQVLAAWFPAPHSYTTQDTLELQGHGGPAVLQAILELALAQGARLALPGEFTQRAFLGGRLDLTQAEAVAQLVGARSRQEADLALAALEGGLSRHLAPLRQALLALAAPVEAAIDYPEDLEDLDGPALARQLGQEVARPLAGLLEQRRGQRLYLEGALVVLCGRPNVGKSSLFNALLGQERALVHELAGTTRDTLEEGLLLEGLAVRLVDTAGLGADLAPGPIQELDQMGQERARRRLGLADLALVVLDASTPLTAQDHEVLAASQGRPRLLALNKCDLAPSWAPQALGLGPGEAILRVSARQGLGLKALTQALAQALKAGEPEPQPGQALANLRQAQGLEAVLAAARRAQALLGQTPLALELVSLELGEALAALGAVDGQGAPDEVIEAVFSQFCLGK